MRKGSSQEETYVKEELKIKRKKIIKRIKEEAYCSGRKSNDGWLHKKEH